MCPVSMTRGLPLPLSDATELPWTSAFTSSAKPLPSSRHTRAPPPCGGAPEPRRARRVEQLLEEVDRRCRHTVKLMSMLLEAGPIQQEPENAEHDQGGDCRRRNDPKPVIQRDRFSEPVGNHRPDHVRHSRVLAVSD